MPQRGIPPCEITLVFYKVKPVQLDTHQTKPRFLDPDVKGGVVALIALLVAAFIAAMNETSIAVALPAIMTEFEVDAAVGQWAITGVFLTMAVLTPAAGWIIDRLGTRTTFLFACGSFLAGTVAAALSTSFSILMVGRVLQGVGTGIIMPLLMAAMMTLVLPERRGTVMGAITIVLAVGPALGPTYGGLMMSVGSWHLLFWALVPLSALTILFGLLRITNLTELKVTPLDVLSLALSVFAFGGLVYGLSSIGLILEGDLLAIAAPVVGVIALVAFGWRQFALEERALLNLMPLRTPNFVLAVVVLFAAQASFVGVTSLLPTYLQGALLLTALAAGLVNLPGGIAETALSPVSGMIYDKFGPRAVVIPGVLLITGALFWLSTASEHTVTWMVVVAFTVMSTGIALAFTPLMTTAMSSVAPELYAHGSAAVSTLIQLAAAAGASVTLAVYARTAPGGGSEPAAIAEGAGAAFLLLGIVSVVALVLTFFVRKPATGGSLDEQTVGH